METFRQHSIHLTSGAKDGDGSLVTSTHLQLFAFAEKLELLAEELAAGDGPSLATDAYVRSKNRGNEVKR